MPFSKLMGVEMTEAQPDKIMDRLTVRSDLCTTSGLMHGSAFMRFATERPLVPILFCFLLSACGGGNSSESAPNVEPQIISNFQTSTIVGSSESLIFKIEASDPEDSIMDFQWGASEGTLSTSSQTTQANSVLSEITWTAPVCSDEAIQISVIIVDAASLSVNYQFSLVTGAMCTSSGIQPAIQITRTSGEIPFHVYVSSSDTTAIGVTNPYDQLEYSWDFDDTQSEGSFVHPVTGNTVEANTDQTGPEASFVYRNPGTYTITLTAKYQSGNETLVNYTSTTVTVSDWSGETRYFDPESGNDANTGLSTDAPWQTWSTLVNWITAADYRQALIKRDTEMSVNEMLWQAQSHIRIGAYGSGAAPILTAESEISAIIRLASDTAIEDHVYSDLHLDGNNGSSSSLFYARIYEPNATLRAVAFLDMTFVNDDPHGTEEVTSNMITIQNPPDGFIDDVLVWNSTFIRNHSIKNGIYAEIQGHFAVIGSSFSGGDGNSIKDHPIYPATVNHAQYRWIDFQQTYSNNFSINSAAKAGDTLYYTLVDGCNITGGQNGLDFSRHNSSTTGWFSDLIIQNNAFHGLGNPSQGYGIIGGSLERATIRNNQFYDIPYSDILVGKDGDREVSLQLYGNKIWKGMEPANSLAMLDFQDIFDLSMTNNVFVNEGVTGGSTNIGYFIIPATNNWHVDGNQYWAPGIGSPIYLPGEGSYSFSEWQSLGHDLNGSNTNPGFVDPVNGIF